MFPKEKKESIGGKALQYLQKTAANLLEKLVYYKFYLQLHQKSCLLCMSYFHEERKKYPIESCNQINGSNLMLTPKTRPCAMLGQN